MTEAIKDFLTFAFAGVFAIFGVIFGLAAMVAVIAAPFVAIGTGIAGAVWVFSWIVGV